MNGPKIILVDDEALLLESLEIILTFNKMDVVATANDGYEALEILKEKGCDLALVDLNMKGMGGLDLIEKLKKEHSDIKILVLTTFYDDKSITRAISGGADGYILKDSGKDAIIGAIKQIMNGQNVIDSKVMQRLSALVGAKPSEPSFSDDMTSREKEICTLMTKGLSNKQIACALYISEGTVKNYISSIYDKTGIHDRAKLIVALSNGA